MKTSYFKFAFVALLAIAAGCALAGMPIVDPETIASFGTGAMFLGETSIIEIKSLIEKQGEAWAEFKKTNDQLIAAKADGKAVGDLETKLAKISADMDKLGELKSEFDAVVANLQRNQSGGDAKALELDAECKGFNAMLRADFQSKGKSVPEPLNVDTYAQYKSAFFKVVRNGNVETLSSDERKALSAGSDPDGGYLLPTPTVGRMVKKIYEQSIMRQLADVVSISTDALEGVTDNDEADAGWVSETGTRSNSDTPQIGKYRIEAHEMYAMPKVTQKLIDDAATDVEGWLADKVADKFARVEGTAFWQGTGAGQPRGLASYTTAATADDSRAWGQFEHVKTGTNGDFNATTKGDPLHDLLGAFKDQYLQRATFVMRREVRTKIRKLKEATTDRYLWEPSLQAGTPDRLNGYPVRIDQYMPALAADSLSLAFGDFKEAYTIVDRIGVRTLRDPYTAKPYVVFYSTKRTGGGAVNFEAVKFLKFAA